MKPNILQYATEAQALIDREYKVIAETTQSLAARDAALVLKAESLLQKELALNTRESDQDHRDEEIVRKENLIRESEQARIDRESATQERLVAEKLVLKATTLESEMKQKEAELYAREVKLSEKQKTYKEEVKREFASSLLGRLA